MARRNATTVNLTVNDAERAAGIIEKKFYDDFQDIFICKVNLKLVKFDTHQRPHDQGWSSEIASTKARFTPYPVATYRQKTVFIEDGQQRIHAEMKKGREEFYIGIIFTDKPFAAAPVTKQTANAVFFDLNNLKRMDSWVQFAAGLNGGKAKQMGIMKEVQAKGFATKITPVDGCFHLSNTKSLEEAYGKGLLSEWLTLMAAFKTGYNQLEDQACRLSFQRGVLKLLILYGNKINLKKVTAGLKAIGSSDIADEARVRAKACRLEGRHFRDAMAVMLINRGDLPPLPYSL